MPTFSLIKFTNTSACTLHLTVWLRTFNIEVFNGKGDAPVPCTDVFSITPCYSWNGTSLKSKIKIFCSYDGEKGILKWKSNNHLAEFSSLSDNLVKVGII